MGGGAGAGGGSSEFQYRLESRLAALAQERHARLSEDSKSTHFVMPVGLLLVIDDRNGGDVTAQELVRRFDLLHQESGRLIDFYFMGWQWVKPLDRTSGIKFDLRSFGECRELLKRKGVRQFGGNADLILVDAHFRSDPYRITGGRVSLDFTEAIRIDLASRRADAEIPPVGELLQMIIDAAEAVRRSTAEVDAHYVAMISDKLGLATAKQSLLTFILDKFGAVIGARKLNTIAVRNLGPLVQLDELYLSGLSQ